ncbi:sulfate respiration complex protein HmcE [uncultured Desulfovibrio sp.]|uniref:sulfate respiration complex protein HmcE n=1 Tax=uncultured Desulfovibrio sp. TaxID=167968 RepID=UPI002610A9B6|nr:respiratory nitrate reductase subunit gamma [uncultured Desulfovibrio sp.]
MIDFISGPLFIFSLLVFVAGLLFKAVLYVRGLDAKLERVAYSAHPERSIPGILASIFKWLVPGGTQGWRTQPMATVAFFLLHFGAVLLPLFLLGHTVLLEDALGISLPSLPGALADLLAIMSLIGLALLVLRRLRVPAVRHLTTSADWLVLVLTILPFLTGVIARFASESSYSTWIILHVLSGELFLILAPFTKLSHIVLFFMSRAQLGMDYAIKRGGRSRGGVFPW